MSNKITSRLSILLVLALVFNLIFVPFTSLAYSNTGVSDVNTAENELYKNYSIHEEQSIPSSEKRDGASTKQGVQAKSNNKRDENTLNTAVTIEAVTSEIESGQIIPFVLTVKFTGNQKIYENAKLIVSLPNKEFTNLNQDLEQLEIAHVTPSYNEKKHQLVYDFEQIKAGQTYDTVIKLSTENGIIPNNTELKIKSEFFSDEETITDEASTMVLASHPIVFTKEYNGVEVDGQIEKRFPQKGDLTIWSINVEIPKKNTGQLFLDPSKEINMLDSFSDHLEFVSLSDDKLISVSESANNIEWSFVPPTLGEQEKKSDKLVTKTFQVKMKVKDDTDVGTLIKNKATVSANFIGNSTQNAESEEKVMVVGAPSDTEDLHGYYLVIGHFGPKDGLGHIADFKELNPNPTVYPWGTLKFAHYITSYDLGAWNDFKKYDLYYDIDDHLKLLELKTPGDFWYQPTVESPKHLIMDKQPRYEIYGIVNGEARLLIDNPENGKTYTREELGLNENDKLSQVHYHFTYAPAGMAAYDTGENPNVPTYTFKVEEGYTGEVKNGLNVIYRDYYNREIDLDLKNPNNMFGFGDVAGERFATVVPEPTNQPPIATIDIDLLEHEKNTVISGENRVKVKLTNTSHSTSQLDEVFESFVLLPIGVMLSDETNEKYSNGKGHLQILENNYNGTGRQLVKINWDQKSLLPEQSLTAAFDVFIFKHAPSKLIFDVYGFTGNNEIGVPTVDEYVLTDTVLQTDEENWSVNGDTNHPRLKSGNSYTLKGHYNVVAEKMVKGSLDSEYTLFGKSRPGEDITYKLKINNTTEKPISSLVLLDVLPSIGDLGLTDNVTRGSKFSPILKGPVVVPEDWKEKITIFYSTAENPKRDDLTKHTIYPKGVPHLENPSEAEDPNWMLQSEVKDWSKIKSIKIELNENETIKVNEGTELLIRTKAPNEEELETDLFDADIDITDRAAWNSFAVATDYGQPVEPERVGVILRKNEPLTPLEPAKTKVSVKKVWKGKKLDSIKVHLLADGKIVDEVVLSNKNNWEHTFTDLPVVNDIKDEKAIEYTVQEVAIDGYNVTIDGNAKDGFTITNLQVGKVDIPVKKTWQDNLPNDRPSQIEVDLLQNGKVIETVKMTADNDWKHTFKDLEQYDNNGKQYVYTIEEKPVKNYTSVINKTENGFEIVNTLNDPVVPPIVKDVEGNEHLDMNRNKEYKYNVKTVIPENIAGYKNLTIKDVLDNRLTVIKADVLVDGEVSEYEATIDGQMVMLVLDREQLDDFVGKEINLQITAKINEDVENGVIENVATLQLNDAPEIESNVVTVKPPKPKVEKPEVPEPTEPLEPEEPNQEEPGKILPKTFTNIYFIILIGVIMLLVGLVTINYRSKKFN